ncbi:hypothetical protein SKAU_G00036720 [Synaphobranchus kaupii]|uniref:Uncharacterized protein n=1 Tax=Synaphobranchus kaupii TaxID=118154 RepID=A0A9Q1GEX1_SYNKA|nr:hypothetical protein SKAU_G00036720 [Synaphobranchus kaupii]
MPVILRTCVEKEEESPSFTIPSFSIQPSIRRHSHNALLHGSELQALSRILRLGQGVLSCEDRGEEDG